MEAPDGAPDVLNVALIRWRHGCHYEAGIEPKPAVTPGYFDCLKGVALRPANSLIVSDNLLYGKTVQLWYSLFTYSHEW
jgi:hypothetical protein